MCSGQLVQGVADVDVDGVDFVSLRLSHRLFDRETYGLADLMKEDFGQGVPDATVGSCDDCYGHVVFRTLDVEDYQKAEVDRVDVTPWRCTR